MGKVKYNAHCLDFLIEKEPAYGYYPEAKRFIYICKGGDEVVEGHVDNSLWMKAFQ